MEAALCWRILSKFGIFKIKFIHIKPTAGTTQDRPWVEEWRSFEQPADSAMQRVVSPQRK